MRVCPKCKEIDPPIWKHQAHKHFSDYCHFDNLLDWDKELYDLLKNATPPKTVTRGEYRYHLSKAGYVQRIAIIDLANPSNPMSFEEPPQEKAKYRYHHEYKKIDSFGKTLCV